MVIPTVAPVLVHSVQTSTPLERSNYRRSVKGITRNASPTSPLTLGSLPTTCKGERFGKVPQHLSARRALVIPGRWADPGHFIFLDLRLSTCRDRAKFVGKRQKL